MGKTSALLAPGALNVDVPAMRGGNRFDDGQAEPIAWVFSRVASAVEALEQMGQVFGKNADASIRDDQDYLTVFLFQLQADCAVLWRELERIFEQVTLS